MDDIWGEIFNLVLMLRWKDEPIIRSRLILMENDPFIGEETEEELKKYSQFTFIFFERMSKLKSCNDYIVHKGKKYGLPKVVDSIHRENDCMGKVLWYGPIDGCVCDDICTCHVEQRCDSCSFTRNLSQMFNPVRGY